jgi:hypothetical protein
MATSIRSDMIVPEVLAEAVRGEFAGVNALYGTGAAFVTGSGWPNARGGDTIKVPYFGTIGEMEDLASDEGAGSTVPSLTPAKLDMSSESATVAHSGKAIEMTRWAQLAAMYTDPYGEAARQLRIAFERRIDKALLTEAGTTSLAKDIYDGTTNANGRLTWQALLGAKMLWGDETDDIALVIMHSNTLYDLLLTEVEDGAGSTNMPLFQSAMNGELIRAPGVGAPIKVSDRATLEDSGDITGSHDRYTTLLVKRNALALWFSGGEGLDIQTDRDILSDTDVAALHTYYVAHLYSRMPGGTNPGVAKITHNVVNTPS